MLTPRGSYVLVGGPKHRWLGPVRYLLRALATSLWSTQRLVGLIAVESGDDMDVLAGLMETGSLRPYISRRYDLSDAAEALRHLGTGHAAGKVVIAV